MKTSAEEPGASPSRIESSVHALTRWLGSTWAFMIVVVLIIGWLLSRHYFDSTEAWQNAIMVTLAIVTFLLLFLLQRTQNKAMLSIQLKLNEIVATQHGASNRLIDMENLSEVEIAQLHLHFQKLATRAKVEENLGEFHTVEEAVCEQRKPSSDRPIPHRFDAIGNPANRHRPHDRSFSAGTQMEMRE